MLAAAERIAGQLAGLGVGRGDLVPLLAETSAQSVHAWLGVNLAGAADVPLNTAYRGASLAHGVGLCRARLMIADRRSCRGSPRSPRTCPPWRPWSCSATQRAGAAGLARPGGPAGPAGRPAAPRSRTGRGPAGPVPDGEALTCRDTASVLFTSGTTGPAKGVIMTHAQTYAIAQEIVDGLRVTGRDIFYCFHPMFHMTRFGSVYTALLAGCPVVLDRRFDAAAFLDRARRYGATATIGHGPMLEAIYRQPERPDDADNPLRTILTAPLPARIAADFERRFGVRAIDTWGMTEVTCVTMRPYQTPLRPGSCGRPRDDLLEVRIVDPETDEVLPAGQVGEITVRPREPWVVMQGYLGMPDLTVAAWRNFRFHSGDFGYLTPDGYLYFAERSGDRIRRRAENVSAYDIESAAASSPAGAGVRRGGRRLGVRERRRHQALRGARPRPAAGRGGPDQAPGPGAAALHGPEVHRDAPRRCPAPPTGKVQRQAAPGVRRRPGRLGPAPRPASRSGPSPPGQHRAQPGPRGGTVSESAAAPGGPLAGIRVIDLSRLAPGPYGSMLLADLGAEVIAVTGGRAGQVPADFARGKRFVHLNLKHPASRQALHRLVAYRRRSDRGIPARRGRPARRRLRRS